MVLVVSNHHSVKFSSWVVQAAGRAKKSNNLIKRIFGVPMTDHRDVSEAEYQNHENFLAYAANVQR
jgi:hypothetical protein